MFEWRQHPTLSWLQVSNYGCIKINGKPKHPHVSGNGYLFFFYDYPKRKSYYLHRVIAETFLTNILNEPIVDHINGNKLDNAVTNLRWANRSINANNIHVFSVNVKANKTFYSGEIWLMKKLRAQNVSFNYIGAMFHISGVTAKKIINCGDSRYLRN